MRRNFIDIILFNINSAHNDILKTSTIQTVGYIQDYCARANKCTLAKTKQRLTENSEEMHSTLFFFSKNWFACVCIKTSGIVVCGPDH